MERKRELKRNLGSFDNNKKSVNKKKIIRRLLKDLEIICVEVDPPQENYVGELLQGEYQELSSYYDKDDEIIKDLQDRINKIKKQENTNYNRELALFLCRQLLKREKK